MGLPLAFLALGIALTALIALLQQSNASNQRQIIFDAASARVQQSLVDIVNVRVGEFQSGINFIAATHPGPLEEYQTFFNREVPSVAAEDPGVLFLEFVSIEDVEQLKAREVALGNPNFAVTLLPAPTDQRTILTRLSRESSVFGLPLLGLDVTVLHEQLLPTEVGPEGFELVIASSDQLVTFVSPDGNLDPLYAEYSDYTAFLVGKVFDESGELLGYSINFQTVSGLLEKVTDQELDGLSVELYVEGIDEPVGGRRSPEAPEIGDAELIDSRDVVTASLKWRVDVWADDDFGPATGLRDQLLVLIAGLGLTSVAYAAALRRRAQRHNLNTARFELAHARTLAQTDALTGLLNRNGLIDAARHSVLDKAATVFFIDLDGFKSVNDSEGHERGDQVLRAVAVELRSIFRSNDLVGRIGGDEFVVFTRRDGAEDYVAAVSTRITEAISKIDKRVTCSLGVASRSDGQRTDVKDLLRSADTAMYEAKRSGGDRFAVNNPT